MPASRGTSRITSLRLALLYGGGIMGAYVLIGFVLAAILGASAGSQLAASPWLNTALGLLLLFFAFNLFGLFEIQLPSGLIARMQKVGGGPGSGPVVLSAELAPFAPLPYVVHGEDGFALVETASDQKAAGEVRSYGRMRSFHGQMGMFVRAFAFMLSHGADGLRRVAEDAVLNANYVMAQLTDDMSVSYPAPCMHEVLFDDSFLKDTGVTMLDFAKAMIDEGFHPATVYFPLVVQGALLTEPTESESKESLDRFIGSLRFLARRAKAGDTGRFTNAPRLAPIRRLDETQAARHPVLRWRPPDPAEAAE